MSNNKYDVLNPDYILGILNADKAAYETIQGTNKTIADSERQLDTLIPNRGWYNSDGTPMTKEQYIKMINIQKAERARTNSVGTGQTQKNNQIKTRRKRQLILAAISALATVCALFLTKNYQNNTPIAEEDITKTISETSNFNIQLKQLSAFAIQNGILKQEEGLFKQPKLNIPVEDFIELANIDSNDHISIYLWNRLGVPINDILKGISLKNTTMYYDTTENENAYYASVINQFGGTIEQETPLGTQYAKLMEEKFKKMPKDERDNLITNLILEYNLARKETDTKGGNYGR